MLIWLDSMQRRALPLRQTPQRRLNISPAFAASIGCSHHSQIDCAESASALTHLLHIAFRGRRQSAATASGATPGNRHPITLTQALRELPRAP
eukprot:CAMPEP_0113730534 /NCGR_PEP_ID=MMETSP0038_2-20120614/43212_1 /TAXON_ID=2898 /ORGANISM="Cryptomonas paramecium" /LENGTH=92 /DNA_ID=CAMNT_0000662605 /DNA_START=314 /DNA_END=588 /DNA_ORIENTATION=+ /assembly_acc=CAM_ASM_000170